MSRRASLPGADELFRRTSSKTAETQRQVAKVPIPQEDKSTKLQVASAQPVEEPKKAPKHDEKITFYCTAEDLMSIERTRLELRSAHKVSADRGRIVRAALNYVLQDFQARGDDSILIRELEEEG